MSAFFAAVNSSVEADGDAVYLSPGQVFLVHDKGGLSLENGNKERLENKPFNSKKEVSDWVTDTLAHAKNKKTASGEMHHDLLHRASM